MEIQQDAGNLMTEINPENLPDTRIKSAWDEIKRGNFDDALRQVENISKDSCDYTESRLILARVAWLQGFTEAAMAILDEAAKNHPGEPRILAELAVLQLEDGRADKALGILGKADVNDTFLPEAEITRYAALHSLGEKEQAHETLKSLYNKLFADEL